MNADRNDAYPMGELEVVALRSLNMKLFAGELLGLLGASGSGKSATARGVGVANAAGSSCAVAASKYA